MRSIELMYSFYMFLIARNSGLHGARVGLVAGVLGGYFISVLSSTSRLTGDAENSREVLKYGIRTEAELAEHLDRLPKVAIDYVDPK